MNHKLNFLLNPEQFSQLCMLQGGGMEIGREGQTKTNFLEIQLLNFFLSKS